MESEDVLVCVDCSPSSVNHYHGQGDDSIENLENNFFHCSYIYTDVTEGFNSHRQCICLVGLNA